MTTALPNYSISQLKAQAKRLREELATKNNTIGHSKALELIARQYGFKDWNTLHAAIGNRAPLCPISLGQRMRGSYLGQAFEGEVIGIQSLSGGERHRVTWQFDNAVDVVTFEGMTNFRKRVSSVIGNDGKSLEKTSNGQPQMIVDLPIA